MDIEDLCKEGRSQAVGGGIFRATLRFEKKKSIIFEIYREIQNRSEALSILRYRLGIGSSKKGGGQGL